MKGCSSNNINSLICFTDQKTLIHIDSSRVSLCNSYILTGNRVRVKSSGIALGLANPQPPGSAKLANAPPPGLKRRANTPQQPGGRGLSAAGTAGLMHKRGNLQLDKRTPLKNEKAFKYQSYCLFQYSQSTLIVVMGDVVFPAWFIDTQEQFPPCNLFTFVRDKNLLCSA